MLHEVELTAEEIVFVEGDPGSSMFIIAYGRVRVFDQQRILNTLGAREVFGEMALLDPEPRIASVSTMEETLLLRIDHQPFFELLADRREVAYGIIRVLSHYVRERVADIQRGARQNGLRVDAASADLRARDAELVAHAEFRKHLYTYDVVPEALAAAATLSR